MKPTNKAPAIDALLSGIFGKDRTSTISEGKCVSCDSTDNNASSFRDDISKKEYSISGMCQSCQDDVFGVADDEPEENFDRDGWDDEAALGSAGFGMDETYF